MQYILSQQEYDDLKSIGDRAAAQSKIALQAVCSDYANFHHKAEGRFGGGACKNGDPFIYCTDCPAFAFCPSESKEYSK